MGFKWIIKENIPCLYELSWQEKKPAIILRIHKDFAKTAMVVPGDAPIVKVFMESFKFSAFAGNLEKDFGFDNAFVFRGENGDFVEFSVPVPQVKKYTGKRCDNCKGEGIEDFFGEKRKCGFCDGTGKEHFFD